MITIQAIRRLSRLPIGIGRGIALAAFLALLSTAPALAEASHGHIRTVEGTADLLAGGTEPAVEAAANYPIQVGDQVLVAPGGRMEVVLPDASVLRIDANTKLRFARLAHSVGTNDDRNSLQILQGQIQVSLVSDPIDQTAFRLDTANSSLFLLSRGSYRIFTDGKTWTQVIVREGFVEVVTERGTSRVSAGQQGLVDGGRSAKVTVQAAPALDSLELWASRLEAEGATVEAQTPYRRGAISPTLGYSAARLHRHGRWLRYRGSQVWRPHVATGWRPYHSGWWTYTPAGLTWVSTEPWGWVPYHYGVWGHAGGIGWVWYPGHRYTPGAVYWYWGPTHVGWVPAGYYSAGFGPHYYSMPPYGHFGGLHGNSQWDRWPHANPWQVHARAGGDVARWHDWTFSSYDRFGYRDSHRFLETGAELQHRGVFQTEIPEGVMTTETRNLTPNLWHEPRRVLATLERPGPASLRSSGLSPLGAAALDGASIRPWRPDARQRTGTTQSGGLVRQWDPDLWQRDHRTPHQTVTPYRRDTRGSSSSIWGYGSSSVDRRRGGSRLATPGISGRSHVGGSRFTRPAAPGIGRSTIGGPRSPTSLPRSGVDRGRAAAPGRSSGRSSGRVSGSGRPGRSMSSGASRSTSGDGGSG